MKLAIVSRHDSPNTQDILHAAKRYDIECSVYHLRNLAIDAERLSSHEFFSHDIYLMRGYSRNLPLAQSLAQTLLAMGKIVIDNKLAFGHIPTKFHEALTYKLQGIPHIRTLAAGSAQAWRDLGTEIAFPVVIKDVNSQKGKGVRLCHDEDSLIAEIEEYRYDIIVQEFMAIAFDIRVICIGDKIIGAIKREAAGDDFRTNISLGGTATLYELSDKERALALSAHKCMGYEISGVDIAHDQEGEPFIIETNIAPEWQGFKQATGIDVGEAILEYVIQKADE